MDNLEQQGAKNIEEFRKTKQAEYDALTTEDDKRKALLYKTRHPNIKTIFDRIRPRTQVEEFKKVFLKKMRIILGPLSMNLRHSEDQEWRSTTLEDAFVYLGQATARLAVLEEAQAFLQRSMDTSLPVWLDELWKLRELSQQQVKTCTELVRAVLYKMDKNQQENKTLPMVKEITW